MCEKELQVLASKPSGIAFGLLVNKPTATWSHFDTQENV